MTGLMVFTGTMMVWAAYLDLYVLRQGAHRRCAWIVKDPPLGSFTRLARVAAITPLSPPSCSRWRGQSFALCDRLRGAVGKLVASLGARVAVDNAVLVTIDRVSGALAAGDKSSAAKQGDEPAEPGCPVQGCGRVREPGLGQRREHPQGSRSRNGDELRDRREGDRRSLEASACYIGLYGLGARSAPPAAPSLPSRSTC